jgi:hypothetical protein
MLQHIRSLRWTSIEPQENPPFASHSCARTNGNNKANHGRRIAPVALAEQHDHQQQPPPQSKLNQQRVSGLLMAALAPH